MCVLSFAVQAGVPEREARDLPRLGRQSVRRAPVLDLLQDLHREGVGHELRRDLGRLGRSAHQGPRPVERDGERAAQLSVPKRKKDGTKAHDGEVIKTLIESFQYPRKGPGMMWDAAARQDTRAGRPASTWARALESLRYDADARAVDDHDQDGRGRDARPSRRATSSPRRRSSELVEQHPPDAGLHRGRRRRCAIATSSPWR